MAQEKVTRKELRAMHVGQTRIFNLVSGNKVKSAKVTCDQLKNEYKIEFDAKPDYEANAISITRLK